MVAAPKFLSSQSRSAPEPQQVRNRGRFPSLCLR
jgi:hypothetical protein